MSQAIPTRAGALPHEHAASDIVSATPNRAMIADGAGHLTASDTTDTELSCLAGVTSAVQTQLDAKAAASHTHALADLTDVSGSPADGDVLAYDGGTNSWQPAAVGGASTLAELADVDVASPASGEVLRHDGTSWTNAPLAASDITFGDIATDSTTGMRVGTSGIQKLGFWGATPIGQPADESQSVVTLNNFDSDFDSLPIGASYDQLEIQALRTGCEELADDVRALAGLVHALRLALVNTGLIKGSA